MLGNATHAACSRIVDHRRSRTARRAALNAVCVAVTAFVAACGGDDGASDSGAKGSSAGAKGSPATTGQALSGGPDISGKEILFAIGDSQSNSFWVPVVNGAKAAAAMTGVELRVQYGSSEDEAKNVNEVRTAIAGGVDALAVRIATKAFDRVVCDARDKDIPVVAYNINGATGEGAKCVQAFVGQDFVQSGRLIAQRLIADGKIKQGDKVFCPVELPTQTYAVERAQGVNDVLQANGSSCDILGTGVDLAPAKSKMVSYLLGHRDTAAIIALGGTPLSVAADANKQVNREIPIGGFDLSKPVLDAINGGAITASVDQQPYAQGFYAVMQLALNLKYGLAPASVNTSGSALVDKGNVEQVMKLVPNYR
jgi:simple sugar transport system substrate-binding protein